MKEIANDKNTQFVDRKDLFMIELNSTNYEEIVGLAIQKIHQLNNEDVQIEEVTLNIHAGNLEEFYVECNIAGKQKVDLNYYGYDYENKHFLRLLKTENGYLVKEFESDLPGDLNLSSITPIQMIKVSNLDYFINYE